VEIPQSSLQTFEVNIKKKKKKNNSETNIRISSLKEKEYCNITEEGWIMASVFWVPIYILEFNHK
jgi:hypothetical protein